LKNRPPRFVWFGIFEVDLQQGELHRKGQKIKLQELPFQFLVALLERPGDVVTREELARKLWGGALVDFDNGLNTAAKKLREALGDDATTPRYVETLPRRGYRFIAPVRFRDLQLVEATPIKETPPIEEAQPQVTPPVSPRRWRYLGVLGLTGLLVLALPLYWLSAPSRPPHVVRTLQLTQTGRVEIASGVATDGSRVYFTERTGGLWSLAQVSAQGGVPQPLPSEGLIARPDIFDISPDRSNLLVAAYDGIEEEAELWSVPTVGGTPRRIGDVRAHAGAWSRDGSQVAFARGSALFLVNGDGTGYRKLLDTPGAAETIRWAPAPRPDVLRFSIASSDMRAIALWEVNANGTGLHLLLRNWKRGATFPDGENNGTWLAAGRFYLFRSQRGQGASIWARAEGRGFPGVDNPPVQIYSTPQDLMGLAPAPDGKRIFFAGGQERRELVRYDGRRGQFLPYLSGAAGRWVSFSKDAQWVAYTIAPQETLWRSRPDGSEPVQLTSTSLRVYQPSWSPDGTRIAFDGGSAGQTSKVYVIPSAGGVAETITVAPCIEGDASWSPDGNSLVFARILPPGVAGQAGLYVMDWKTRKSRFLPGSEDLARAAWSPDSRYLAATRRGGAQIQLLDFKTGQWTVLAAGSGLSVPFWSRDAQYVYFQEVLGGPEQPVFRVQIRTRKIEKAMGSSQIPQSNLTGYVVTGLAPDDAPVATVLRSNSDIYALELDLP
jgi:Tol biopolymer transport system component/DNA-binding winged helix-turn-helix (wHTH) protein